MLFDESRARRSLLRVHGSGGEGTAFFFDPAGLALTCHHAVEGAERVGVTDADGRELTAEVVEAMTVAELDVAVLRVDGLPPAVLPLGFEVPPAADLWTSGFQLQSANVTGPFPALVRLDGTTDVRYVHGREYSLNGALRLSGGTVSPGLSGAPVVVLPEGVVVGIATADFDRGGGFAVSLAQARAASSALRVGMTRAALSVPAYGRYLNAAGARELCRMQVERQVQTMIKSGQFLPDRFVERDELAVAVDTFRASRGKKIFPLIGRSGVGKSTFLAALSREPATQPSIFLPAHRAELVRGGLSATLAAELKRASKFEIAVDRMVEVLAEAGGPLLVIIDGLNEARTMAGPEGRAWLEDTFEWLAGADAQIIVSSRIEFWSLIAETFPSELLFTVTSESSAARRQAQSSTFELRDFSDKEMTAAAVTYRLSGSVRQQRVLRHPLLTRLYAEQHDHASPFDPYSLLDLFVSELARRISRALEGRVSEATARHAFVLAARAAAPSTLAITTEDLFHALAPFGEVREKLLSENVLIESSDGFRFQFDQVADFLLAQERELPGDEPEAWTPLLSAGRPGWLRFAFARMEHMQPERVPSALSGLLSAHEQNWLWTTTWVVKEVLLALTDARPLKRFLFDLVRIEMNHDDVDVISFSIDDLAQHFELDTSESLGLCRQLLPWERSYRWKEKHWREETIESFFHDELRSDDAGTTKLLLRVVRNDFRRTSAEMIDWLDDGTQLAGGDAGISDVARAYLFLCRHDGFDSLCDLLVKRVLADQSEAVSLFTLLVTHDPGPLLGCLQRWFGLKDPQYDVVIARALSRIQWSEQSESWIAAADRLVAGLLDRRISHEATAIALGIAARRHPTDELYQELLALFLEDDEKVTAYGLWDFVPVRLDEILRVFKQYVDSNHELTRKTHTIQVLKFRRLQPDQVPKVIRFLEAVLTDHPELSTDVARSIEDALYDLDPSAISFDILLPLVRRLLRTPNARDSIAYYLRSRLTDPGKIEFQRSLIDEVAEGDYSSDVKSTALQALAGKAVSDDDFERIRAVAAALDGESDGRHLIGLSYDENFADRFAKWIRDRPVRPGSPVERMKELVDGGWAPRDAAREVGRRS